MFESYYEEFNQIANVVEEMMIEEERSMIRNLLNTFYQIAHLVEELKESYVKSRVRILVVENR